MKVTKLEVSTVYPSERCEPHVMYLSGADHIVRPRHVPIFLFYRAREDGEQVMPTDLLKNSVANTLSKFYPIAGRLRKGSDGKLEIVCNNAGVEFVEATVDGSLDEFDGFNPKLFSELLDPVPVPFGESFTEYPITYIQVTRFACGGVSLVITINHACVDGLSVNQFLTSWSEVARGLEMSTPPVHNRTLLKVHITPEPGFRPKELRSLTNLLQALPKQNLIECMFSFTPERVMLVKKKAIGGGEQGAFSTFEAISAHVWRSVTKARGLDSQVTTRLLTPLDMRRRLNHTLPKGYFGNAICFVRAEAKAGYIVNNSLSYTANCIRKAVEGFSETYYSKVIAFAQTHENPLVMNVNWDDSEGCDVCVSSWVRFNFMNLDFGSGNPTFCSPGKNPYDGAIRILPTDKGNGHINIFLALKPDHMKKLISDAEFLLDD